MVKHSAILTLFFSFALSLSVQAGVKVDEAAPDFELVNEAGKTVKLSDYQGKYVVLEWTNHLCPYVKKHYESGNMPNLQSKYTDKDVVWLQVISSAEGKQGYVEAEEAVALNKERQAAPSHVLFDPEGDVGKLYGAKTTPHMYIINPEGELKYAGAIDSIKSADPADIEKATNYVDTGLTSLMAGGEVENKLTPPYGCSVKYKS
ncbi:redoxin domain-containing protein [Thalassotalea sp. PS06]|uniref:redoxin domain-containing protein n=1 Tax=Thalassotalea sp. PS06 TaxID=2594005 RepID=UPI00116493F3|nr:redoxin domain-containing protein [Thalassotalea sp. PS06]QDP02311.1 redoxin domain-containing protein [Thalassotalea sp. PS06]